MLQLRTQRTGKLMGLDESEGWIVEHDHVDMTRQPRPVRPIHLNAEPQSVTIDANKTALLIVDMQNDFSPRAGGCTRAASTSRPTASR